MTLFCLIDVTHFNLGWKKCQSIFYSSMESVTDSEQKSENIETMTFTEIPQIEFDVPLKVNCQTLEFDYL